MKTPLCLGFMLAILLSAGLLCLAPSCDGDVDGDGVPASQDCADDNPDRYPGNPDIPNDGIDQDCDGSDATGTPLEQWPSSHCGQEEGQYPVGNSTGNIRVDGLKRTFRVHVPAQYDGVTPLPLVFMLHGGGGSAKQFEEKSSHMDQVSDHQGFIVVFPDGTGNLGLYTWNGGGCCGYAVENNIDDVAFIEALTLHLEHELCLDRRRVYSSGMSNGGIMSHRLGCELANRIAAIGPVSGTIMIDSCNPGRAVPVMHIHGTDDPNLPWNGGVGCGPSAADFTSVPATIAGWVERDGCLGDTTPYFSQGDGHCEAQGTCQTPAEVVLCTIEGGNHSWPGGEPTSFQTADCPDVGHQSTTFYADEVLWEFFKSHPMPQP